MNNQPTKAKCDRCGFASLNPSRLGRTCNYMGCQGTFRELHYVAPEVVEVVPEAAPEAVVEPTVVVPEAPVMPATPAMPAMPAPPK